MIKISEERMSNEFLKTHLLGMPVDVVIHHFTAPDKGLPHCHPFGFTSFILSGGYVEKVYNKDSEGIWTTELIHRLPGTSHTVEAEHIHEIVELPEGECYTIILPQPKVREARFWRFDEGKATSRAWFEDEFK